jgi:4,5-dihydroxyphthalate decarboxylase
MKMHTAFWSYDRTSALRDGRVDLDGLQLEIEILTPEQTFARSYQGAGFDICEASFSNSATMISKGQCPYVLVPAFLSRAFRHSCLFVRTDRGIHSPRDLIGKTVGLQEYDMTAAVVIRGLLRDEYGVQSSSINWRVGEVERLKPLDFPLARAPENIEISLRPPGLSLEAGLLSGELDAIVSLRTPMAIANKDPLVRRLFDDQAEREWFVRTGLFPIMHAVGVKRSIAEQTPGLTRRIYEAFESAKNMAVLDLEIIQVPKVTLPWPAATLSEVRKLMGHDFWPYGISSNRRTLETQLRWSREDGLLAQPVQVEDIFASDCLDT